MASSAAKILLSSLSQDNLTLKEALSGVFGSISLATWIFLLVPQLILNYKTGSADGISLAFLAIWLLGDATNLAGAIWAGLVPTVIAVAVYFCFADFVLISQCLYYNKINATRVRHASTASTESEQSPLLSRRRSSDTFAAPNSQRRRSTGMSTNQRRDSATKIFDDTGAANPWVKNSVSILGTMAAGAAGWAIAWQSGVWKPTPEQGEIVDGAQMAVGAQILGYVSAVCYLGARIPQIIKNYNEKSCEGLSLLFFLLSLMGNLTYGIGILCHSVEKEYITTNLPWLIGSLGTMVEDGIIFLQFRIYAPNQSTSAVE